MQHSPHTRHYDEQKNESKTGTQSQAALDGNSAGASFTGKKPDWSPLARISAVDVDTTAVVTTVMNPVVNPMEVAVFVSVIVCSETKTSVTVAVVGVGIGVAHAGIVMIPPGE